MSARKKLRIGLAVLWLRMAMIWKRDPLNSLTEYVFLETDMATDIYIYIYIF